MGDTVRPTKKETMNKPAGSGVNSVFPLKFWSRVARANFRVSLFVLHFCVFRLVHAGVCHVTVHGVGPADVLGLRLPGDHRVLRPGHRGAEAGVSCCCDGVRPRVRRWDDMRWPGARRENVGVWSRGLAHITPGLRWRANLELELLDLVTTTTKVLVQRRSFMFN